MTKTFRKKMGKFSAVYDGSMQRLSGKDGLEFVLSGIKGIAPKLTKKDAETWKHNISVWCALNAKAAAEAK